VHLLEAEPPKVQEILVAAAQVEQLTDQMEIL
jgi:hypothetical protein